ncbi:MAG: GNAT family N-acetyltransferase [Desulfovibrionaceae bacterium]|jgi:ribosomal protein S18 acetylase RimI-like enzyme|nr:GNAT family N-acetyltransferase [Desulfovibrionaceae bacterium]
MPIKITPIAQADAPAFRECLDRVARERRFLAFLEAPALEHMQAFVAQGLRDGVPRVVGKTAGRLIGWCDIQPGWPDTLRHCGGLGMGVVPEFRGQGVGQRLLESCLALARQAGITRVELEARSDNEQTLRFYRRAGFEVEGVRCRRMRIDGEYKETTAMALLL